MFNPKKDISNSGLMKIFCVHDSKAEHYGVQPFCFMNAADALRGFEQEANSDQSAIGKYPGDFTLFEIGTWNLRTGEIEMYSAKKCLGCAVEFVKKPAKPVETI